MTVASASPGIPLSAFQLAEAISIRECRASWPGNLLAANSQELFYGAATGAEGHTSILSCGVVVHAGRTEAEMAAFNQALRDFCRDPLAAPRREEFRLLPGEGEPAFGPGEIRVRPGSPEALRIVMLYTGRSLALDYYEEVAKTLLREPEAFVQELEKTGRLKPSRKTVLRYIGRTMEARARVIDTLHAFEAPAPGWDDEYLDRLDRGMNRAFDIEIRFKAIRDQLDVAKENLDIFSGLLQHRESMRLEWIIIALFAIEVVRVLFD
jgi:uncharacterized Rmd1/YagE family protein